MDIRIRAIIGNEGLRIEKTLFVPDHELKGLDEFEQKNFLSQQAEDAIHGMIDVQWEEAS